VRPSSFRDKLLGALASAVDDVRLGQSQANGGNVEGAKLSLENAYRDLSKFVQRLNLSRRRRLIAPGVAGSLAAEGRSIRRATVTLAGTL
jgi:hypothetical protein